VLYPIQVPACLSLLAAPPRIIQDSDPIRVRCGAEQTLGERLTTSEFDPKRTLSTATFARQLHGQSTTLSAAKTPTGPTSERTELPKIAHLRVAMLTGCRGIEMGR